MDKITLILKELRKDAFLIQSEFGKGCSREKTIDKYNKSIAKAHQAIIDLFPEIITPKKLYMKGRQPERSSFLYAIYANGFNDYHKQLLENVRVE